MANFYTDIPELKYHLNNPMMERICQLKERDYRDKDEFDYAPQDYADAMDSYDKILEITGEIQVKPSLPMPKEWTKKVLTAETDVWNMLQEPNKTWMRWSKPD